MENTIAAISTAYGEAGIGVLRISGEKSLDIALSLTGKSDLKDRFMHYCKIYDVKRSEKSGKNAADDLGAASDAGEYIDEALICYMKSPHTYTGEDIVEIQCHGSGASMKKILSLCLELGASMAEPGEFTKRAFLNGRLDLSQAEAVIDLIKAKTERSLGTAARQLGGALSAKVGSIRDELKELLIKLEVDMDYPDEDIEELSYRDIENSLSQINDKIKKLLLQGSEGRLLREGLGIAIIGKPNVGKSSLMNLFMGEERSIVSRIAGTTRDTIEESAQIRGIEVRLIDTAGIHESSDPVEKIGIERSRQAFEKADLVLLVLDASEELSGEDRELLGAAEGSECIVLWNKTDKEKLSPKPDTGLKLISTSFKTGEGFEELKDEIEKRVLGANAEAREDPVLSNIRHIELLRKAEEETAQALDMTRIREAVDIIEISVNAAFGYLGEITGDTARGEIIDEIFSRFCLGK